MVPRRQEGRPRVPRRLNQWRARLVPLHQPDQRQVGRLRRRPEGLRPHQPAGRDPWMQAGRSRPRTRRASVGRQPERHRPEGRVRVQAVSRLRVGSPASRPGRLPRARPQPLQARHARRHVDLLRRRRPPRRPDLPLQPCGRLQRSPAHHLVSARLRQASMALEVIREAAPPLQPASRHRLQGMGPHRRGREDRRRRAAPPASSGRHYLVRRLQGRQPRRLVAPRRAQGPVLARCRRARAQVHRAHPQATAQRPHRRAARRRDRRLGLGRCGGRRLDNRPHQGAHQGRASPACRPAGGRNPSPSRGARGHRLRET